MAYPSSITSPPSSLARAPERSGRRKKISRPRPRRTRRRGRAMEAVAGLGGCGSMSWRLPPPRPRWLFWLRAAPPMVREPPAASRNLETIDPRAPSTNHDHVFAVVLGRCRGRASGSSICSASDPDPGSGSGSGSGSGGICRPGDPGRGSPSRRPTGAGVCGCARPLYIRTRSRARGCARRACVRLSSQPRIPRYRYRLQICHSLSRARGKQGLDFAYPGKDTLGQPQIRVGQPKTRRL